MSPARAYLAQGRLGDRLADLSAELDRLRALFAAAGAEDVEPAALQPAELLLNLYGEDLRARAFLTEDPVQGDLILRPEFTAPVALLHRSRAATSPARYAYSGAVWRRQAPGSTRPTEFLQAGVEAIGEPDAVNADAEIFALIAEALAECGPLQVMTGDLSIALAAIAGLPASARRKSLLRRHLWRPARFRALLETFGPGAGAPTETRAALLEAARQGGPALAAHIAAAAPEAGLRAPSEIAARARALAEEAAAPPLDPARIGFVEALLDISGPAPAALARMRSLADAAPQEAAEALAPALERMARRLDALDARGVQVETLPFDASFGRALEYYDGFTFEFRRPDMPHLPPLGGGGRYDALTARLGLGPEGAGLPAIGGAVRPEAMLAARLSALAPAPEAPAVIAAPAERLRLGVPSKGRLKEATVDWFAARGVTIEGAASAREYSGKVSGIDDVDLVLLSAGEIPRELTAGRIDLGVTGTDLIHERIPAWETKVEAIAPMGFGHADLIVAIPASWVDVETAADLDEAAAAFRAAHGMPLRVATKYHSLARRWFQARGVADYRLVDSQGATEGVVRNEAAEAIVDITSTGATLTANHLKILDDPPILTSQATLWLSRAARRGAAAEAALAELRARAGAGAGTGNGAGG